MDWTQTPKQRVYHKKLERTSYDYIVIPDCFYDSSEEIQVYVHFTLHPSLSFSFLSFSFSFLFLYHQFSSPLDTPFFIYSSCFSLYILLIIFFITICFIYGKKTKEVAKNKHTHKIGKNQCHIIISAL